MPSRKLIPKPISKEDMKAAAMAYRKDYITRGRYRSVGGGGAPTSTKKARRAASKRSAGGTADGSHTTEYMKLILNPCHGPLVRSVGTYVPGSVIERVRSTITLDTTTNDSGYIVFFPSYHGTYSTAGYVNGSILLFTTATPSVAPVNTTALPLGSGTATSSNGTFIVDPISANIAGSSAAFSRAQCLSACVQLDCLTALSTIAGQVAIVSNYSMANFNRNSGLSGGALTPPSVDEVFAFAATRERLNLEGHEVRWRPSDHAAVPRSRGSDDAGSPAPGPIADAVMWQGKTDGTGELTKDVAVDPASVKAICIAWRGVPKSTSSHVINIVKVCSLELAARNNCIEQLPTGSSADSVATTIDSVTNALDRAFRTGWQVGKGIYDFSMSAMRFSNAASGALKLVENNYAPALRARTMKSIMNG